MADWNEPDIIDDYVDVFDNLLLRDVDAATLFVDAPSNPPTGAIRYLRASDKFQEWDGAAWVDKVISVAGGGTGGATGAAARAALGLGTIATQNANAVAITGGSVAASLTGSTNIPATALTGLVPTANLGTGAIGAGQKFLADNQTYIQILPAGVIAMWPEVAPPSGYVLCDGTSYLRAGTMAALFAVIGTRYGAADGTHFNVPNMLGRFPISRSPIIAAIDTVGEIGGTFDHTHTVAAHTHTIAHTHDLSNHSHTIAHDHSLQGHTHGIGAEALTAASPASGLFVDVQAGVSFTVTTVNHAHAIGAHSHGGATGGPSTANTGGSSAASSAGPSNNNTGASSNPNTGLTSPVTDAQNPPFFTVNFIIKF